MTDYYFVVKELDKRNFTLVTTEEEYKGVKENIKFLCNRHNQKGVQEKIYHVLSGQTYGCNYCWIEANSGEHHYRWDGGISKITSYLREKISEWKLDSMSYSNYKCEVSGVKNELMIHHIYSFSKIVKLTLAELNLDVRGSIGKYNIQELKLIEEKCNEIHYRFGLGACLNVDVHKLFHSIYTNYTFTPDDYEEFKGKYNRGDFNLE